MARHLRHPNVLRMLLIAYQLLGAHELREQHQIISVAGRNDVDPQLKVLYLLEIVLASRGFWLLFIVRVYIGFPEEKIGSMTIPSLSINVNSISSEVGLPP